jgi:uncharacterized protein involved in exopolysaccharide biosynthesis
LIDYLLVVWRYRWMVGVVCVLSAAAAFGYTTMQPKIYEATTTLIAPRESGSGLLGGLAVSGLLQQLTPGLSLPSFAPNRDMLMSILRSRTVRQAVVEKFGLQERYQARHVEDAINTLGSATNVSISKEGVIAVRVEDTDPQLAAQIANFYVQQLDRLVAQYDVGEAGRQRKFLTEQLARAKTQLESAEESLRRFQERNRAIVLQEQTRGAIDAAARLKGEIMATEVQLQVIRSFATEANPEVVALKRRIDEMKRQLAQMQYGDGVGDQAGGARERRDFVVPFARVPEVGLELARLTRDVKVQETLVSLLTQQFEQVKMAEARDNLVVQMLDRAVPPIHHSRPSLRLNVGIAGMLGLSGSVLLAFVLEYTKTLRRRKPVPIGPKGTRT